MMQATPEFQTNANSTISSQMTTAKTMQRIQQTTQEMPHPIPQSTTYLTNRNQQMNKQSTYHEILCVEIVADTIHLVTQHASIADHQTT